MNEEQPQQESAVKRQTKAIAKNQLKKAGKKALKKLGKVALKLALKAGLAVTKVLLAALAGIGVPFLLILGAIILVLIIIFLATSMFFSVSEEEDLEPDAYELQQYIQNAAANSIDPSKPEQIPYQVPPELIISAMQLYESTNNLPEKEVVDLFVEALKPNFTYATREGFVESEQTTCEDGECNTVKKKTPFTIEVFESVEAWDRVLDIRYEPHYNDWVETTLNRTKTVKEPAKDENGAVIPGEFIEREVPVVIKTKSRSETFVPDQFENVDYTYYDRTLSNPPFEYGMQDKLLVEALYMATGKEIFYKEWSTGNSLVGFDGTIIPGSSVPSEFMEHYLAAEKAYRVDWYYIAAIHFVETGFSTHPTMISSVGAEGHTQFMPCTWLGWGYPGCKGTNGFVNVSEDIKYNPIQIKKYGGFGIDADKNGIASPWDAKDAIFAAASYLNKNGFSTNIDKSIRAYNHSDAYVKKVNETAARFKSEAMYTPGKGTIPDLVPGSFMMPANGLYRSKYGPRSLGTRTFHYGVDISNDSSTPIVATAGGIVSRVVTGCPQKGYVGSKCGGGWGNHVFVKHVVNGQAFEAVYAHFSRVAVSQGQPVVQGQLLGNMGTSGSSTGVHLHFEMHIPVRSRDDNAVNPALYIPIK